MIYSFSVPPPAKKAKTQHSSKNLTKPMSKPPKPTVIPQTSTPVMPIQGMLKTRKNNLTLEDGNRLKQEIASLSGEQQMTVLEILKENDEHLEQDEEGNVEMEFREFTQKSIDDLKDYVKSVLGNKSTLGQIGTKSALYNNQGQPIKPPPQNYHPAPQQQQQMFDKEASESDSDSSSSSESDSDSDSD